MKRVLFQNLTIFSDGSTLYNFTLNNKKVKTIENYNKDLKNFQKIFKVDSSKSLANFSNTSVSSIFRKKLFK